MLHLSPGVISGEVWPEAGHKQTTGIVHLKNLAGTSILVTGGAGFLGINLVRFLLTRKCQVTVLDVAPFTYQEASQVRIVRGDIRHRSSVLTAMKGVDSVVHAAAALPLYTPREIFSTDVTGTEICLQVAQELGLRRFVHVSSTAVYGIPDHHPVRESDPLVGIGPYGKAKIQAEKTCEMYRQRGMCIPVLRPKSFIGPERLGVFTLLYDWAASGCNVPLPGGGQHSFQLLDVADLCHAIGLVLTLEEHQVNQTFNVGAATFSTMGEDFQAVLDFAGFGRRVRAVPLKPALVFLQWAYRLGWSPVYPWIYRTLDVESWVSTEKIRSTLGFCPCYSNRDALLRNYEWFLQRNNDGVEGHGLTHRNEWSQGILALLKIFF